MAFALNGATDGWVGRSEATRRLLSVVQQLSLARDLAAIQKIVRHAARELTGADGATFVLREGDVCHYADEEAIAPLWKGQRFPMETCISGWAMLHREAVAIPDIYADARIPHDAYRPTFVKSLAMVPIRTIDPVGAIGVYWATPHRTSADELELIQALADTVAVAMENVAVRAELEQRVRDRTAEMLAAKEEAERANRAKSRFMAAASHDLRQPLQTIAALTALLERAPSRAEQKEIAASIRQALGVVRNILDALLDINRLDGDAIKPELKEFQIGRLLERVAAACERQALEKGLRLRVAPCAVVVRSDPTLLERVVQNFVTNAIRYTPSGVVSIGCRRSGPDLRIEVRDTGIGIPEDQQGAIFQEYYRVNGAGRGGKGLGLGLAIAERIARLLGHRLEVRSATGKGSTFSVVVPRACTHGRAGLRKRKPENGPAGVRLLLVEDDAAVRQSLERLLEFEGFRVVAVGGAEEALASLQGGESPDVIVSDYRLPGGRTGVDLVGALRARLGKTTPGIVLTGDIGLTSVASHGAATIRLLHKPVDADALVQAIGELTRPGSAD